MDILKLKRQIRDWFNKNVNDEQTLNEVGKVIGFRKQHKGEKQWSSE